MTTQRVLDHSADMNDSQYYLHSEQPAMDDDFFAQEYDEDDVDGNFMGDHRQQRPMNQTFTYIPEIERNFEL